MVAVAAKGIVGPYRDFLAAIIVVVVVVVENKEG
jgi:hypothetical protein